MSSTKIQWTNRTWNPTRGCSRVSPGCEHCYAERQAARFAGAGKLIGNGVAPQLQSKPGPYHGLVRRGKQGARWTGKVVLVPEKLSEPLRWRKPCRVFVNSMSDLFHESLSNEEIAAVFGIMAACPQHTFQILTKRSKRMREWFAWIEGRRAKQGDNCAAVECLMHAQHADSKVPCIASKSLSWPLPNVWLGVSAENQQRADERIPDLLATPAAVRWVSAEPLLGSITFDADWMLPRCKACGRHSARGQCCEYEPDCTGGTVHSSQQQTALLDWIVCGGESGPGARRCNVEWIRSVVRQCEAANVPVFVKQLGAVFAQSQRGDAHDSRDRKGSDPSEWPIDIRVRNYPEKRAA